MLSQFSNLKAKIQKDSPLEKNLIISMKSTGVFDNSDSLEISNYLKSGDYEGYNDEFSQTVSLKPSPERKHQYVHINNEQPTQGHYSKIAPRTFNSSNIVTHQIYQQSNQNDRANGSHLKPLASNFFPSSNSNSNNYYAASTPNTLPALQSKSALESKMKAMSDSASSYSHQPPSSPSYVYSSRGPFEDGNKPLNSSPNEMNYNFPRNNNVDSHSHLYSYNRWAQEAEFAKMSKLRSSIWDPVSSLPPLASSFQISNTCENSPIAPFPQYSNALNRTETQIGDVFNPAAYNIAQLYQTSLKNVKNQLGILQEPYEVQPPNSNNLTPNEYTTGNGINNHQNKDSTNHNYNYNNNLKQKSVTKKTYAPLPIEELSKIPLSNFGNDYSQHYVTTGVFPQTHIQNALDPAVGYPRIKELLMLKAQHFLKHACHPYLSRLPIAEMPAKLDQWATNDKLTFDVVLVGGCYPYAPSLDLLKDLPVAKLTPRPSLGFVWVPSHGIEAGRRALEAWGFRCSEDIVFMVNDVDSVYFPPQHPDDYLVKSTWHCLMGLKGTLRRSEDYNLINCNVNTDTIVENGEEVLNIVPEQLYSVIENLSLMTRRVHIIPGSTSASTSGASFSGSPGGTSSSSSPLSFSPSFSFGNNNVALPIRPRPGWVIISPDALENNFAPQRYILDMKQRGHLLPVDPIIDSLRPKTPPRARRMN